MSEMLSFSILLPLCLVNFHMRKIVKDFRRRLNRPPNMFKAFRRIVQKWEVPGTLTMWIRTQPVSSSDSIASYP